MKTKIYLILTTLFLIVGFEACSRSDNPVMNPPAATNILSNSLFETGSAPSLSGWSLLRQDTSILHFSSDACPGVDYSINIKKSVPSPECVYQHVPAPAGTHSYELSFWAKERSGGGSVYIGLKTGGLVRVDAMLSTVDTNWAYYTLHYTTAAVHGDSLVVELVGGYHEPANADASTYFAFCKLDVLDP